MIFLDDALDKRQAKSPSAFLSGETGGEHIFEILVRESLAGRGNRPVKQLHALSVERVRAGAQAKNAGLIMPLLNERELEVYRRGRNTKVGGVPKSATTGEYHSATGLEALFGWLYLRGEKDRLDRLFGLMMEDQDAC